MNIQVVEKRLQELAGGAEMVSQVQIRQYTGMGRTWSGAFCRNLPGYGEGRGRLYHIHDVARALTREG